MNTSGTTSVTLQDLTPNAEYDVEVAAISSSDGTISNFLLTAHFTLAQATAAPTNEILQLYYIVNFCPAAFTYCIEMCMHKHI